MRKLLPSLVLIFGVCAGSQNPAVNAAQPSQRFDGKWWGKTSSEEHAGFINGAGDCLTWTAHKEGFNATPEELTDKISKFYKKHPESAGFTVVEVWEKLWTKTPPSPAAAQPGETWKNAHWYLDGDWWREGSPEERQGFVKGYLWCMRTQVPTPAETYSKSVDFYVARIDAFTRANANSKMDREAVASTLKRYRDSHR